MTFAQLLAQTLFFSPSFQIAVLQHQRVRVEKFSPAPPTENFVAERATLIHLLLTYVSLNNWYLSRKISMKDAYPAPAEAFTRPHNSAGQDFPKLSLLLYNSTTPLHAGLSDSDTTFVWCSIKLRCEAPHIDPSPRKSRRPHCQLIWRYLSVINWTILATRSWSPRPLRAIKTAFTARSRKNAASAMT